MKSYLTLLTEVLTKGSYQDNRTGIKTLMLPGAMLKYDLAEGFPAVTTKKLAYKAVVGELLGFLRGYTSAAQFRELGCKIWDQNANENKAWLDNPARKGEDDLGYIYSRLWTDMPHSLTTVKWDQIQKLIEGILKDPTSRRLIVNAWHPEVFDQAALPPCHYGFQVIIEQSTKKMHLLWNQRSCDLFLGVPFNIASYATLLQLLCQITGYTPGTLTGFLADVHIYENHIAAVVQQLTRDPLPLPTLEITGVSKVTSENPAFNFNSIGVDNFVLHNYVSHDALKAPMAV